VQRGLNPRFLGASEERAGWRREGAWHLHAQRHRAMDLRGESWMAKVLSSVALYFARAREVGMEEPALRKHLLCVPVCACLCASLTSYVCASLRLDLSFLSLFSIRRIFLFASYNNDVSLHARTFGSLGFPSIQSPPTHFRLHPRTFGSTRILHQKWEDRPCTCPESPL